MKYQIYLNKRISDAVNAMAQVDNKKPNSLIKEIVETLIETVIKAGEVAIERSKENVEDITTSKK